MVVGSITSSSLKSFDADAERMKAGLESIDVDERDLVGSCHSCFRLAVNPILVFDNSLVADTDFGIRIDEKLVNLRAPRAGARFDADG